MRGGQDFIKWLRPAGCALFLGLFVLVTVILFTSKGAPVAGYEAPHTAEYYSGHLSELAEELSENLIPRLGVTSFQIDISGDRLSVTASEDDIYKIRPAVIHYYDADLFEWVVCEAA